MGNRFDLLQVAAKGLLVASGARFLVLTDLSGNPLARSPDCPDWFVMRLAEAIARNNLEACFPDWRPVGASVSGRVTVWAWFADETAPEEVRKGLTAVCLVIEDLLDRPDEIKVESDWFQKIPPVPGGSGGTPFSPATMYATDWIN